MAIKFITEELIVLDKQSKEVECSDGVTRTYFSIKVGSGSYENQIMNVSEELYNALEENQSYSFRGHFGGLKQKFWGIDNLYDISSQKKKIQ